MNTSLFISRFLYRIRYQLIFGSLIVVLLVAYFVQFLPKKYTVNTTIYTGIASNSTITETGETYNIQIVNNTFDNLINLVKSKGNIENVSFHLLAMNIIHGNPKEDNMYITAKNYQKLQKLVPNEIESLVDKNSIDKTVDNFKQYNLKTNRNFFYSLFNGENPHYSYKAISKAQIKRIGNSDMIELSYTSNDPGITTNTVKLLNKELLNSYNDLRYKSTNDVIAYFENEVAKYKKKLNLLENDLTNYNIQNNIINYEEQTKSTAYSFTNYEDRYEEALKELQSSSQLLKLLETQLETKTKLFHSNQDFIKTLDDISTLNGKITEIETFTSENAKKENTNLEEYKEKLRLAEKHIAEISTQMDTYKYSKEGIAIDEMVNKWLEVLLRNTKAKAEFKVLSDRRKDFQEKYKNFSPVGTEINRREREIKITENSYLEVLHALNLAYLRKKNIQLTTSGLETITEPAFPLLPDSGKRLLLIIAAFLGSIIFIIGLNLLIELLDRTLRDGERTRRLTGLSVLGAFSGIGQLRYRGYSKACNRIAATYACNRLNYFLKSDGTTYINIFSIEKEEGKSFIIQYMIEEWEKRGVNVKHIKAGIDFSLDASYYLATNFNFIPNQEKVNIIIIEYPAIQYNNIPRALLQNADINLLVINACRVWKKSDNEILQQIINYLSQSPIFIYLNNASRITVEDYTGNLPPQSSHNIFSRLMMHLGLTAKKASINSK